ncbi:MAG: CoA-binding protein [Candidatus Diapherotrites archaeon]|uniref:CoA-binding protein n=1 Tax=Candidatus Iainarchaeum sp. TaxID=3101447 RepID=A0A8T5GE97_9ARCH|nr:CoA-binding protein [Candidatus Diapherotrites archaeon]
MSLNSMFNPKSVAVIGASNTPGKVGYAIVKNMLDADFEGKIYPINLKEKKVQGLRAYASVTKVAGKVDLAIIVIPSKFVPSVMKELVKKGTKNVVIITAGFGEVGTQGIKLQEEISKIVEKNKMNVVGPNTLGIINSSNGLNASFAANFPRQGEIAIVSQSGALCTAILDWARQEKVGFSKFISTGNKAFLDEGEYFEYLENDPMTKAVFVYMESVKGYEQFLENAYSLAKKKPVVLIKSGRSPEGKKAASSHTGAISGNDEIFTIACKKANVLRMNSIEGFFDMAKLLSRIKEMNKFCLAVVTNAGGPGVIAADSASNHKFPLPRFSKKTLDTVKNINPHASNPLDLIGDAKPIDYRTALTVLQDDKNVDLVYVLLTPQSMTDPDRVADIIVDLNKRLPIMCSFLGGVGVSHARRYLREHNIVEFVTPERGIKALARFRDYALNKKTIKKFSHSLKAKAKTKKLISSKQVLSIQDTFEILKEFNIPTVKTVFVSKKKDLDKLKLKLPVALKATSGIPHKTNYGLVKAGIKTHKELEKEVVRMQKILKKMKKPSTLAVQEMVKGEEVLVSSITNEFGKIITFGLGGIFVEVMKDISQKIAPINESDIDEMFEEVKGAAVLKGARTKKKYNVRALKKVIKLLNNLALTYPELQEIEMNPIIVNEKGAYAIDAIMIK